MKAKSNIDSTGMNTISAFAYRSLSLLARLLPLEVSYLIGETLALLTFPLLRTRKRNLERNLRVVLSQERPSHIEITKLAIMTTLNFGRAVVDAFVIPYVKNKRIDVTFSGMENLGAALGAGKGVILVTAHLGTWELGGAILADMGYRFVTVAGVQFTDGLSPHIKAIKKSKGIDIADNTSILKLYRVLKSGGIVVLHIDGDRYFGGVEVSFFGKKTLMPRGPAALAIRTGAKLLCGFAIRRSRCKIKIIITPEIPVMAENEAELTQRVVQVVQTYIGKYKDQWCMFRPIWGTLP